MAENNITSHEFIEQVIGEIEFLENLVKTEKYSNDTYDNFRKEVCTNCPKSVCLRSKFEICGCSKFKNFIKESNND